MNIPPEATEPSDGGKGSGPLSPPLAPIDAPVQAEAPASSQPPSVAPGSPNPEPPIQAVPPAASTAAPTPIAPSPSSPPPIAPLSLEPDEAIYVELGQRLKQAMNTIKRSPHLKHQANALHTIPWFCFLGNHEAGMDELLTLAGEDSPFPPPTMATTKGGQDVLWHWWFYRSMVAIRCGTDLLDQYHNPVQLKIWTRYLKLLHKYRRPIPLNGIVVTVSAKTLLDNKIDKKLLGRHFRVLIDETYKTLQIRCPTYVFVTQCQKIFGFHEFFTPMPQNILSQAFGHRLGASVAGQPILDESFNTLFDHFLTRLKIIRLSLLQQTHDIHARRGIYDFVENFASLRPGLEAITDSLVMENPYQYESFWRGLYFTAQNYGRGFTPELFGRFLPTDAPLATRL